VVQFFSSAEDDLLRRYSPDWERHALADALHRDLPNATEWAIRLVENCQTMAERESSRARRSVLTNDTWLEDSLGFGLGEWGGGA
jgi:preprotein translocase subunit SecA